MRILIIAANALSKTSNNGKTYRSFIQTIGRENVAQFYTGSVEYPDEECCANFYRVTDFQVAKSILKFWEPVCNSHNALMRNVESAGFGRLKDSQTKAYIKKNAKYLSFARDFVWWLKRWDNKELDKWIRDFNPTHIFAILGNGVSLHRVARRISKAYNIPLSVYFTDDYILNDNSINWFQKLYFRRVRRCYAKTLEIANNVFVIGTKMKQAYEEVFKRNFGILINGISFKGKKNKRNLINSDEEIIISYIGGLHLNRWKSIVRLAQILTSIGEFKFNIRVFSVKPPELSILEAFKANSISYCGALTPEGVLEETQKSHIMLHVESFDKENRLYTQYSVSTKIPEYMSSMRGIIAFGPHEIASIEIFKDNKIGCVITDLDNDADIRLKLTQYIKSLNDLNLDFQYDFAKANFNQDYMQLKDLIEKHENFTPSLPPPHVKWLITSNIQLGGLLYAA